MTAVAMATAVGIAASVGMDAVVGMMLFDWHDDCRYLGNFCKWQRLLDENCFA